MIPYISTPRLIVYELTKAPSFAADSLVEQIPNILSESVVANLPPHFHEIANTKQAHAWLELMLSESRLFVVKSREGIFIGFIFISENDAKEKHIGYLLAEAYWGKGLAYELLKAFLNHVKQAEPWLVLVGGVDKHNIASAKLLLKLGFQLRDSLDNNVDFYELHLN